MMDIHLSRCEIANTFIAMDELQRFGALIRKWRNRKDLRADEVAAKVGLGASTFSNIETGVRKSIPDPVLIQRFHDVLGVPKVAMLEALGYLDVDDERDEVCIDRSDPRVRLLQAVETYDDDGIDAIINAIRFMSRIRSN